MHLPLVAIERKANPAPPPRLFPASLPLFHAFEDLLFDAPITFFVGENGSGKSTLLEAIACLANSPTVGAAPVSQDPSLAAVRAFSHDYLRLVWRKRSQRGFFLRAEDFFGFARRIEKIRQEHQAELRRIDADYEGRSDYAKGLASMPYHSGLNEMEAHYGARGLDANSHGEGFLKLFESRMKGAGLYLLDEPETPLSPTRQLSFITMLQAAIQRGAQFIIATHSPILLAFPGARIYSFDQGAIHQERYENLDHVRVMRDFLNNPSLFIRHLLDEE